MLLEPQIYHIEIGNVSFVLRAPVPPRKHHWAIVGSTESLGSWNVLLSKPLVREEKAGSHLFAKTDEENIGTIEYKFILQHDDNYSDVTWEKGANRSFFNDGSGKPITLECSLTLENIDFPLWRGAGIVIPVFSLKSNGSQGVGDFGDLKMLVDWASHVGMSAIQVLPINDTTATKTWRDSYPYNNISVFALHPIYLDLREWTSANDISNEGPLDYDKVLQYKMSFLQDLYRKNGARTLKTKVFQSFEQENHHWLRPYAIFCHLRDRFHTANFRQWDTFSQYDAKLLDRYLTETPNALKSVRFYEFVQFLLHRQMSAVHEAANAKGIILKGDIPIGISRDSVPAWVDGGLFNFDGQAGAPPDAFAKEGQNWGFPTYNWEVMAKDGYRWWQLRLQHLCKYFDAYRLDHVLGFFRIWEIPRSEVYGILGHFRPALPLSSEEIRHYGFSLDVRPLSTPSFSYDVLRSELTAEEIDTYFTYDGERYHFKDKYTSQRDIIKEVSDEKLRERLLHLSTEVLFIDDPDDSGKYHPRIGAQTTRLFEEISEENRNAFNRLHDDFFYRRHDDFWAEEAMKKLPALLDAVNDSEGSLLPCAEDLGMVPGCVKSVLEKLEVLTLEIESMPKIYGHRFADVLKNPYRSVATISTHDMPPFRLWWKQDGERTEAYWHEVLHGMGNAPEEATASACEQVVSRHLNSPSMLCLLSFQDWTAISPTLRSPNPEDEQINVPSNPYQNWNYRMHITIEQMALDSAFSEKVRGLIERSGR